MVNIFDRSMRKVILIPVSTDAESAIKATPILVEACARAEPGDLIVGSTLFKVPDTQVVVEE